MNPIFLPNTPAPAQLVRCEKCGKPKNARTGMFFGPRFRCGGCLEKAGK